MSSYTNNFTGSPEQPADKSYSAISLTGNLSLTWPIQFLSSPNIVTGIMDVTPTAGGYTLTLPPAIYVSTGQAFIINNLSGGFSFTLASNLNGQTFNLGSGTSNYFYLTNNTTADGIWRNSPYASGAPTVTSVGLVSTSNNVVITNSPIVGAGNIGLALANDLLVLSSFANSAGIAARTGANTWALRNIAGTNNQINVANPKGVAGDPTLSLNATITGITNLTVADLNFQTNTVTTANANENLIINPNGVGLLEVQGGGIRVDSANPIYFYGANNTNYFALQGGNLTGNIALTLPTTFPNSLQVLQYSGTAGQLQWASITTFGGPSTINALARYADTVGSLANSTVSLDSSGNISDATSLEVGNLFLIGNTISSLSANGDIIFQPNGTGNVTVFGLDLQLLDNAILKIYEPTGGGTNFISFQCPDLPGVDIPLVLPGTVPTASQIIYAGLSTPGNLVWGNPPPGYNFLLNGSFSVWQRATSFTNTTFYPNHDNVYTADGWKLLSNGNNIVSVSRAAPTNDAQYDYQMTVVTANAKFGVMQILDASTSAFLFNNSFVLSFGTYSASFANIKVAILAWTGVFDTPTSDPIASWNAQGTNPTLTAGWSYIGAPTTYAISPVPFHRVARAPVIVSLANTSNIAVLFWSDITTTTVGWGLNLNTAKIELANAAVGTPFIDEPFELSLARCKYIFQKDVPYDAAVGTTLVSSSKGTIFVSPIGAAVTIPTTTSYTEVRFESEMREPPTVLVYPITTTTNFGRVSNAVDVDLAADTGDVITTDANGFTLGNNSGGNLVTTGFLQMHYAADAGYNA